MSEAVYEGGKKEENYVDMTLYHIPETLARNFKEFCRLHASNRFSVGLEVLLNTFKDKESYLYLLSELDNVKKDVELLKSNLPKKEEEDSKRKSLKTFGGEIKL